MRLGLRRDRPGRPRRGLADRAQGTRSTEPRRGRRRARSSPASREGAPPPAGRTQVGFVELGEGKRATSARSGTAFSAGIARTRGLRAAAALPGAAGRSCSTRAGRWASSSSRSSGSGCSSGRSGEIEELDGLGARDHQPRLAASARRRARDPARRHRRPAPPAATSTRSDWSTTGAASCKEAGQAGRLALRRPRPGGRSVVDRRGRPAAALLAGARRPADGESTRSTTT